MIHKHKWVKTGVVEYTCPLYYEEKCKCGKTRWKEDKNSGIKVINLTEEEFKRKYPDLFK